MVVPASSLLPLTAMKRLKRAMPSRAQKTLNLRVTSPLQIQALAHMCGRVKLFSSANTRKSSIVGSGVRVRKAEIYVKVIIRVTQAANRERDTRMHRPASAVGDYPRKSIKVAVAGNSLPSVKL